MKDKQRTGHVLIVDDEVAIAYVFQRYFELHGFRTSIAYDGDTALALARDEAIDALVTDFRMPGMTGQQLVERLKQDMPYLPALIVSAYMKDIDISLPGVRVLGKPVDPMDLIFHVKEMLADADTVRSLRDSEN